MAASRDTSWLGARTALGESDTPQGWRPGKVDGGVVIDVASGEAVCRGLSMPHSPRIHGNRLWVLDSGRGTLGTVDLQQGRYDAVAALPGFRHPLLAGASLDQRDQEVWIVPGEAAPRPRTTSIIPVFADDRNVPPNQPASTANADAFLALSRRRMAEGRLDEAVAGLEQAIAVAANPAPLLVDLGNLRQDQGRQDAARLCYERALESDPKHVPARQNLGYLLFNLGETERAADVYDQLVADDPTPLNRMLAASVLPVVYDSREDVAYWRERQRSLVQELVSAGDEIDATTTLLPTFFFLPYNGADNIELLRWRASVIRGRDFTRDRPTTTRQDKRRRIGFISAYFRDHTIGQLNIGRLENLSREAIELVIVYAGQQQDGVMERFRRTADEFVQLPRDLAAAIERLQQLDLDMLVHADVGMDSLTSTLAFSRFAPVQAATWGHPESTGSPMIDYFLSSQDLETETGDAHYTERLIRLPSLGLCYQRPGEGREPQPDADEVRERLGLPAGRRLYGCPHTLFKFHPDFDPLLARILELDPQGELVLLEGRVAEWTQRLRRRFRRNLPDADRRVRFLAPLPRPRFLDLLSACDVLLDPIHFGGGNTSLEAMSMGTPVVTLPGQYLRCRITYAIYRQLGVPNAVALDADQCPELAVQIANDSGVRASLGQQIEAAAPALFDRHQAATDLERALLGCCEYTQVVS